MFYTDQHRLLDSMLFVLQKVWLLPNFRDTGAAWKTFAADWYCHVYFDSYLVQNLHNQRTERNQRIAKTPLLRKHVFLHLYVAIPIH